jgi:hypothetical protein
MSIPNRASIGDVQVPGRSRQAASTAAVVPSASASPKDLKIPVVVDVGEMRLPPTAGASAVTGTQSACPSHRPGSDLFRSVEENG